MAPQRLHGARVLADRKARAALERFGMPIEIGPKEALLHLVKEAAGNVAWLGVKVQEMEAAETTTNIISTDSSTDLGIPARRARSGLIGDVIGAAGSEGLLYAHTEEARAIVRLYGEWTDRLAKYAKAAIDAGIAERYVELAEDQGKSVVLVIGRVLAAMGLTDLQVTSARRLLAEEFRMLAAKHVE